MLAESFNIIYLERKNFSKKIILDKGINSIKINHSIEDIYPTIELTFESISLDESIFDDSPDNSLYVILETNRGRKASFVVTKCNYKKEVSNNYLCFIKGIDKAYSYNCVKNKYFTTSKISSLKTILQSIGEFKFLSLIKEVPFRLGYMNFNDGLEQLKYILDVNIFKNLFAENEYNILSKNSYSPAIIRYNPSLININDKKTIKDFIVTPIFKNEMHISFKRYNILNNKLEDFYIDPFTKKISRVPTTNYLEKNMDFTYSDSPYFKILDEYNKKGNYNQLITVDLDFNLSPLDAFEYSGKLYVIVKCEHTVSLVTKQNNVSKLLIRRLS